MALTKVVTDGIATGAVTATQIAANAVTVDDIADGSISTTKLADDAVTADKLANTAVTPGSYTFANVTVDAQGRVTAASNGAVQSDAITEGNTSAEVVDTGSDGHFKVVTEGSERARIDSSGRLLLGTTSAISSGSENIQTNGNLALYDATASTAGAGRTINFRTDGGATGAIKASISGQNDSTYSYAGRLVFSTAADGASSTTERLRISSSGAFGLSGANYGASGQVLTSQGSSLSPVWQAPAGNPAGTVIIVASANAPNGYVKCNGASLSTTTYADLFAAIGYTYGGSGVSFKVPDLRGEFIRGWDDGRGIDSGRSLGSAQGQATARPNSDFTTNTTGNHTHGYNETRNTGPLAWAEATNYIASGSPQTAAAGNHSHSITGGGDAETRPRNMALLYCIKY